MKLNPRFIVTSIQNKLFTSFLAILLLLAAVVTVSFVTIRNLGKASDKILKMNYNSIVTSINMMDDLENIHREYIRTNTTDSSSRMQLVASQNSLSQWLGKSKDNITEPGEKEILAELETLYNKYLSLMQERSYLNLNHDGLDELDAYRIRIKNKCLQLLDINQKAMFTKSAEAQRISKQGATTLFIVTLFVFSLGIVLSWGLSRRIVRPILNLKHATQRIAEGDYSVQLHPDSEDELGILTREFDQMAGKLRAFNEINVRKIVAEQQKIEAIFANIQDGIFFIGLDNNVLDANLPALHAFQLQRQEVIGHHFLEIIKQDRLFADLKTCLETRLETVYPDHENLLILRQREKQAYYEYFFTPVMSNQKELLGAMFLLRDITNLKELDRLKSEFVMIVSHELKTPLTSINMSIDLLKESLGQNPKASDLELIKIAKEEINRLRSLVNDLLDLSKIEAGKIEMHFACANPNNILESVYQYFKQQVAEKDAVMEIHSPDEPITIWCDEEKLMLVFSNLVANALKAIDRNGKVTLTAERSGNFALFSIQDNGKGIPLSYQNKIFDRFVQVRDHKAAGGTGLGLTITREIVRAHGGSIWLESEPQQGATFFFTIPCEPHKTNQFG